MAKYIGKMEKEGTEFDYAVHADDIFEADERLVKISDENGWKYIHVTTEDEK